MKYENNLIKNINFLSKVNISLKTVNRIVSYF